MRPTCTERNSGIFPGLNSRAGGLHHARGRSCRFTGDAGAVPCYNAVSPGHAGDCSGAIVVGVRPAASREIGVAAVSICGDRSVVSEAHFKACKMGTSCVPATHSGGRQPNTQNASMASARASGACYDPPMREAFRCPNCGAEYQIERVEAAPTHRRQAQVNCAECGGPLRNRDGKFVLKYRRDRSRPLRGGYKA